MRTVRLTTWQLAAGLACCIQLAAWQLPAASLLEEFGLKKSSRENSAVASLPQDQVIAGLKEALAKGVEHAITNLGRTDGFLKDASVKIPLPESLRRLESGLRTAGRGDKVDEFVTTMNRAAEQAVPEAGSILSQSMKEMTIADAKGVLTSTNAAATDYFRRSSTTNLQARFLPIVKKATEATGVISAYKKLLDKTNIGGLGNLGSLGGLSLNKGSLDIDAYVTDRAVDGLFKKIAEQEKLIRQNPAARSTELLKEVFGAVQGRK